MGQPLLDRLPATVRLLVRRIATALAGAVVVGILALLASYALERVGMRLYWGHPDLVPLFLYDAATLVAMLPALMLARGFNFLSRGSDGAREVDIIWDASRVDRAEYLLAWLIVGALIGLALPLLCRRARLLLKVVALPIAVVACLVAVLAIERAVFGRRISQQASQLPPPPSSYRGPTVAPLEGFLVDELSGFPPPEPPPKEEAGASCGDRDSALLSQTVGGRTYQIVEGRDDWGPWQYALIAAEGSQPARALGPFLPGLCGEGFAALDLEASRTFVSAGRLEWIVRESADWRDIAHKRRPTESGRAWRCSLPLSAYERDSDSDDLTDIEEAALLTQPGASDTDGDGIPDGRDSAPHGWYKGSAGQAGLVRDLLSADPGAAAGPFAVRSAESFAVLIEPQQPLHIDSSRTVWMTLTPEEQLVFRARAGVGERWTFCGVRSGEQEILFFRRLALTSQSFVSHGLAGRGYLVAAYRCPNGRWRPLFSWLMWLS
jgi:hypothetical protein